MKMVDTKDLNEEQLIDLVTKFFEANKDDGHGLPFTTYSIAERNSLIKEGVEFYQKNRHLRIRDKYVVIGGFNVLNEDGEWEKL